MSELEAILERVKSSLSPEEYDKLHSALETLLFLTQELEKNRVSVQRLKQLLFGATSEKTRQVLNKALAEAGIDPDDSSESRPPSEKAKGHGRNGSDVYTGAKQVKISHEALKPGDRCPKCNCTV
jgi:hypothetical protein